MFYRITTYFSLLCCSIILIGCSVLFAPQEWSDNYALMDGARSTSPQMIDGKLETVGETIFGSSGGGPRAGGFGYVNFKGSEVVVTLPEKQRVHRIVLHADNLKHFIIYADRGGGIIDGADWQFVKEMQSVKTKTVDLRITIPYLTDRIRILVLKTSEDAQLLRETSVNLGGMRIIGSRGAPGKIREIELYGFKTAEQAEADDVVETREKELDELLDFE